MAHRDIFLVSFSPPLNSIFLKTILRHTHLHRHQAQKKIAVSDIIVVFVFVLSLTSLSHHMIPRRSK
ncbi:hypothetical protein BC939DRAFT_442052 [Gamsiella multidivaricata]|uniref:uncharacterized protein n=1 Tax=Gamsiella multidivaricata TaxID=101098 RepID=UPI00222039EA|nr:uncharacterized protein BC939DRAFT_442052 [Gamsiella multidivaricata]KAI7829484.1 hypothetical protein BC939DRAFT_442052 [Gamsiella multidivaricata]